MKRQCHPVDVRGTAPISYAFISDTFAVAEAQNVSLLSQFQLVSNAQLGIINLSNQPVVSDVLVLSLARAGFPPGSTLLPVHVDNSQQIVAVAAIAPQGGQPACVVANIQVAQPTDVNGPGVPKIVRLTFTGSLPGMRPSASVLAYDATTSSSAFPTPQQATLVSANGAQTMQVSIGGYGATLISIPIALKTLPDPVVQG